MAAGAQPSDDDALVVMAGTNDVLQGIPWEQSAANIEAVVEAVGVDRVVLCTIVPLASDLAGEADFNAHLAELADEHGWQLVDSAAAVRAPDGQWLPGLSEDGIHPTDAGAALLGTAIHDALLS
jgi:lysophospholipase L1-like esterase